MRTDLMMVKLVEAIYWFDESLQFRLKELGWPGITRAQSIILANVANGEVRASRLAEKLGISKQGISQALSDMERRGMIKLDPDPKDRRAVVISFAKSMEPMRKDAIAILEELEAILEDMWGEKRMQSVRKALAIDWRGLPMHNPDMAD
jgi:DNA-binding MarR family transcriptional regulator